ncbi:MAG: hypothetical protein ABIM49_02330 [candidate division WOR-3 bacterium]
MRYSVIKLIDKAKITLEDDFRLDQIVANQIPVETSFDRILNFVRFKIDIELFHQETSSTSFVDGFSTNFFLPEKSSFLNFIQTRPFKYVIPKGTEIICEEIKPFSDINFEYYLIGRYTKLEIKKEIEKIKFEGKRKLLLLFNEKIPKFFTATFKLFDPNKPQKLSGTERSTIAIPIDIDFILEKVYIDIGIKDKDKLKYLNFAIKHPEKGYSLIPEKTSANLFGLKNQNVPLAYIVNKGQTLFVSIEYEYSAPPTYSSNEFDYVQIILFGYFFDYESSKK